MLKHSKLLKKSASFLLSALLSLSVFSVAAPLQTSAVSYSEMSALDSFAYSGNDLGATYTKSSTTFKVWAPKADSVQIKRYTTGSDDEAGAAVIETKAMTKGSQGVWSITIQGDLNGTYYTYLVTYGSKTNETVDLYARTTGVNGNRAMVIDLDSTDPPGWENDHRVDCPNQTDAIIWEIHVRDFSISPDSGMKNKGKYLAFTETGTTVNNDGIHPTGIDYLADLGVTHVHLLPVYDYCSVDETKLSTDQFNWGYDPQNYNTPEGSYSTDPYHGEVRVKEFKQMVQALHNKGIGVIMDVVYNHTATEWFDYTVPEYYYRQNAKGTKSNASGCGNETASDRAMYHKYMIDSLTYWANEYHLDGFRFDLMGIHDCDTMNDIRAELDKIDPQILMYGEPWTAEATTCPKATAVQGNIKLLNNDIGAFNDKSRDAIKGSCFTATDPGFIQGAPWFEDRLKISIQANTTTMAGDSQWSKQPSQTVTYTSAHDNYTLYDKLVKSCKGGSGYGNRYDDLVAMNKLAGGIILTAQGISFFQAGEEFARTKYGDENSYKSPSSTNQIVWSNTKTYSDLMNYYKGLIQIRKAYSPFRDPTNTSNNTIYFSWANSGFPSNVVAFTMYNTINPGTEWDYVGVIHNASSSAQTVTLMTYDTKTLPSQWVIIADGSTAGITSLGTTGSTVTVPARSTMVLVDKASFDRTVISSGCKVTVNHVLKDSGTTYKTETLNGKEGASYSTSPLAELTGSGYTVSSVSGETTGTFTKAGTTVTYYYTIDPSKFALLTVKYQDAESGKSLAEDTVTSKEIGASYSVSPKTISGYECDTSLTANASGKMVQGGVTVIFKYHEAEAENLKVHYYNTSGWSTVYMYAYTGSGETATNLSGSWPGTVMQSEGSGWYVGSVNTDAPALFIANSGVGGSQDPAGVNSTGYSVSGECWIKGGTVYPTGKVNVRYETTDGTLLDKETLKGIADGTASYTTKSKTFDGYELVTAPTNASGLYTQSDITVKYIYKSKTAPITELTNNSTISAESITLGSSVTLTGAASGGTSPYQFAYTVQQPSGSWTVLKDYSTSASCAFTPSSAGSYTVQVKAKDSAGTVKTVSFSLTVASSQELTNNSRISSTSIIKGKSITFTGAASGGTSPYQFAYVVQAPSGSWTVLKNYSTATTHTWTPASVGKYTVQIKVKDSSETVKIKTFTLTVSGGFTNNSKISSTSVTAGSSVTLTGAASGGTSPYQFAFVAQSPSGDWYVLKSYSTSTTHTWAPASVGKYTVQIKAKDGSGTVQVKTFTLTVSNSFTNNSKISATSISKGKSITFTGAASGGTKPYQFAFVVQAPSGSWTVLRNYSTSTSHTWTPASAGKYTVQIKAKDNSGTVQVKTFTLTVSNNFTNNSKISATSISKGKSVTFTGAASGGTTPYQFAYVVQAPSGKWTVLKDYSTAASHTWTPASVGKYTVQIKAKDSSGTVGVKSFELNVSSDLVNTSRISAASIQKGKSVTITGSATGSTGFYQYAYVTQSPSGDWYVLKNYSSSDSYVFTPASYGTYTIQIKVKDSNGTVAVKSCYLNVT